MHFPNSGSGRPFVRIDGRSGETGDPDADRELGNAGKTEPRGTSEALGEGEAPAEPRASARAMPRIWRDAPSCTNVRAG